MDHMARPYSEVQVGEQLPPLKKELTLPRMMAYGAATWDFIRIHYDADYARELGLPAPVVDGQMLGGFLSQLVQDWAGPGAFLRKLGYRNRVMVYPGDTITCQGVVAHKYLDRGQPLAACDLWAVNQRGERVIDPASALVRFPSD